MSWTVMLAVVVIAYLQLQSADTTTFFGFQASLHVWKVIVSNTPKTLREILPTLFNLHLGHLASNSYDKRQVGGVRLRWLLRATP